MCDIITFIKKAFQDQMASFSNVKLTNTFILI